MAILELIDKLINERGSSTIRGEIIVLLKEQTAIEARKLSEVTTERDSLLAENQSLREQIALLSPSQDFRTYRGLLWLPLSTGGYEDSPYCPKCKMVMHPSPPPSIMKPMNWQCSPCPMSAAYCQPPQD